MPYHPCMVYLPTFTIFYHTNQPNVGKYTIHGSYGILYITWMTWVCQNEINGGVFFPSFQVMRESRSERKGMKKAQKQVPLYRDYNRDHPSPGFDHPSRVFWLVGDFVYGFYHGNSTIFHHHLGELVQVIVHMQNPSFVAKKRFFPYDVTGKTDPYLLPP